MKQLLVLLLCGTMLSTFSQKTEYKKMIHDNRYNFYDVVKKAENHFKTHDKNAKGSGYKKFMRWATANEYKYYPSGDRSKEDPLLLKHAYQKFLASSGTTQRRAALPSIGWQEIGPRDIDSITGHYSIGLGRVIDVKTVTQDTIFLSSEAGGLWKSTDSGQNWSPKSDNLIASGADAIAYSPFNHSKMYMDVQNPSNYYSYGVYRSDDGGETWYESNFNPTNVGFGGLGDDFSIFKIEPHPTINNFLVIGTNRGIYISDDDLQTWTRIQSVFDGADYAEITTIAFHPTDPNTFYVMDNERWSADKSKIFITHDLGQTWTTSNQIVDNNGDPNTAKGKLDVSSQCPNCVYFATGQGVWKSTDQGQNFTFLSKPNMSFSGFSVSNNNANNMIYGYLDVVATQDEAQTWQQVTHWSLGNGNGTGSTFEEKLRSATDYVHADLHPAKFENGHFYIGTDGWMCKSADGTSWEIISYGTGIRENYRLGVGQNNMDAVTVGSQDNGTSLHTDHGWVEITGGDGMEGVIHPLNEKAFIASYQNGSRFRSFNEDVTRDVTTPPVGDNAYWTAPMAYDPNDHMTVYDFRLGVWKSTDFGSNWTQLNSNLFGSGYWDAIFLAEIAQNNSQIIYVSNRGVLKKSVDGGITFTDVSGLPNLYIKDIAIAPHDDDMVFVTYGNYDHATDKVYMSTDGGNTWQNITYNLNNIPAHSIVMDHTSNHYIYVGTELGIFYKLPSDTTWQVLDNNLPKVSVYEMEIQEASNYLYATTWGRGLWRVKIPGRENYPEIQKVSISTPPTLSFPKEGMAQNVTAKINYTGTLSSVVIKYSVNNQNLDQTISMSQSSGEWISDTHLPNVAVGDKVYFKVIANGSNSDITESYTYMYDVKPFEYCDASGDNSTYNLHLENVNISDTSGQVMLDNTTGMAEYTYYDTPVTELIADATYNITLLASNSWSNNDHLAWIDFNNDAEFTEDEKVMFSIDVGETTTVQFTVPANAVQNEIVRMRTRIAYHSDGDYPCGQTMGEVEDYAIRIIADTIPPVPDTTSLSGITAECEVATITPPTATDNVDGQITATTTTNFPINTQETTVVTWTFTDTSGNFSTQTQNIIIDDISNPVPDVNSLTDVIAECEVSTLSAPTATDNCAGSIVATSDANLPITTQGTTVVTWTYDDGNGNTIQQTQNIIITPIDNSVIQNENVLIANAIGYDYQWGECSNGFEAIIGENSQSFTATENGLYAVQISNGQCDVTSDCFTVSTLSTNNNLLSNNIKVFPNPTSSIINVQFKLLSKNTKLSIYDINGKLLIKQILYKINNKINIQNLSQGLYILKIEKEDKSLFTKIIKK
jgi:photosystem II stability/assembly factor-like uncharacterized protein